MHIDISGEPPPQVLRDKKRYLKISLSLLALVLCAVLLGVFRVVFDSGHDVLLENIALVLFVGAGLVFVYFAEKLNEHKRLTKPQEEKIGELRQQHSAIDRYCKKVAAQNRGLIAAEYEAVIAFLDAAKGRGKGK